MSLKCVHAQKSPGHPVILTQSSGHPAGCRQCPERERRREGRERGGMEGGEMGGRESGKENALFSFIVLNIEPGAFCVCQATKLHP